MRRTFLKLNDAKTEFLVLGSKHQLAKIPSPSTVSIGEARVTFATTAHNIGAIFDSHLSMNHQISSICQSCYIHLQNINKIRHLLTDDATE